MLRSGLDAGCVAVGQEQELPGLLGWDSCLQTIVLAVYMYCVSSQCLALPFSLCCDTRLGVAAAAAAVVLPNFES
jgi:hypothetical protein